MAGPVAENVSRASALGRRYLHRLTPATWSERLSQLPRRLIRLVPYRPLPPPPLAAGPGRCPCRRIDGADHRCPRRHHPPRQAMTLARPPARGDRHAVLPRSGPTARRRRSVHLAACQGHQDLFFALPIAVYRSALHHAHGHLNKERARVQRMRMMRGGHSTPGAMRSAGPRCTGQTSSGRWW